MTLKYSKTANRFSGKLSSDVSACVADREVTVFKRKPGPDKKKGTATTKPSGAFKLNKSAPAGRYYATAPTQVLADVAECASARSKTLRVG